MGGEREIGREGMTSHQSNLDLMGYKPKILIKRSIYTLKNRMDSELIIHKSFSVNLSSCL